MAEYHVGCGAFAIYAGTLNSRNKNLWQNKTGVQMKRCALLGIIWCKSFLVALIATRLLRVAMNGR